MHASVHIGDIGVYRYIHRALGHDVSLGGPAPKNTECVCLCV
jgi:hypothetical protein